MGLRQQGITDVNDIGGGGGPGTAVDITTPVGPNIAADSVSVTLATDENPIDVNIASPLGQKLSAASIPVVLSTEQGTNLVGTEINTSVTAGEIVALNTKFNTLGQKLMADSVPVVLPSDQSAIPITAAALPLPAGAATAAKQDTSNTHLAALVTDNATIVSSLVALAAALGVPGAFLGEALQPVIVPNTQVAGALGALNAAVTISIEGKQALGFSLAAGTLAGTLAFEASGDDGVTWQTFTGINLNTGAKAAAYAYTNPNAQHNFTIPLVGGYKQYRVRVSVYTSGSANGTIYTSAQMDSFAVGALTVTADFSPTGVWVNQIGGKDDSGITKMMELRAAAPASNVAGIVTRKVFSDLTPAAPTAVSVGVASALAVAANANRKGLKLINTSAAIISLGFGAAAVLNSGITLYPGGIFNMDEYDFDLGAVNAIASAAASNLAVQEYST